MAVSWLGTPGTHECGPEGKDADTDDGHTGAGDRCFLETVPGAGRAGAASPGHPRRSHRRSCSSPPEAAGTSCPPCPLSCGGKGCEMQLLVVLLLLTTKILLPSARAGLETQGEGGSSRAPRAERSPILGSTNSCSRSGAGTGAAALGREPSSPGAARGGCGPWPQPRQQRGSVCAVPEPWPGDAGRDVCRAE